jgi:hypothetical protein
MKVIVAKTDLKLFDGEAYFYPSMGDVIELPDEIAEAELSAGFVTRFEGEDEVSAKKPRKLQKKKAKFVDEDDEEEDDDE